MKSFTDKLINFLKKVWRWAFSHNFLRYIRAFCVPPAIIASSRKSLAEFKNKYAGKRCFIIGNGPSLTPSDLDLIKGEYSFAANRIYYIFEKTEWRPTFYCNQDLNVLKDMDMDALEQQLSRRVERSQIGGLDLMLLSKGELAKVLRYKK